MRKVSLDQIKEAMEISNVSFSVLSRHQEKFEGIGTDTRKDLKAHLFIALKGESFDAHDFLEKAYEQGATAILVEAANAQVQELAKKITVVKVDDSLKALQALGLWARRQFKGPVIGITGSNGKTTTKEFSAAIIGTQKRVHFNKGSFNNHWGVPFTLLQLDPSSEVAVVEMGMNHAGEITRLVEIGEPSIVVCTMVGRAHIEHFGTIEKIAAAKEEIYAAANSGAKAVFNLDNPHTRKMFEKYKKGHFSQVITFSEQDQKADIFLQIQEMTLSSIVVKGVIRGVSGTSEIEVFGAQNLVNLMAAAAIALASGLSPQEVWDGLKACRATWGRNQLINLQSGAVAIFDAYNANPDSMKALFENAKRIKSFPRKIAVLGEMLEMGDLSESLHRELGTLVAETGLDQVYFIGKPVEAFKAGLASGGFSGEVIAQREFDAEMAERLKSQVQRGDLVLFKGSRGMKLERFLLPLNPESWSPKT